MNPDQLALKQTYTGQHLNLHFEIARWGVQRGIHPPMNNGRGCWNYYIFLLERTIQNFNDFWIEPEIKEFSPGGTKYLSYDYYSSPLSEVFWHGGVTSWESINPQLPGQRAIQIGCDYSHLFDQENGYNYNLPFVLRETLRTISEIHPLLTFK